MTQRRAVVNFLINYFTHFLHHRLRHGGRMHPPRLDTKLDKRARTVRKTDRVVQAAWGASPLVSANLVGLAEQVMHSFRKRDHVGADPTADFTFQQLPTMECMPKESRRLIATQVLPGARPGHSSNLFINGSQTGQACRDCFENRSCDGNRKGCKSSEGPPFLSPRRFGRAIHALVL